MPSMATLVKGRSSKQMEVEEEKDERVLLVEEETIVERVKRS